jgi:Fe-S cluster assembly iron-binding protein IscA
VSEIEMIEMTHIAGGSRVQLSQMKYKDHVLFVDPLSEMLLLGTTIDYVQEDYNQQIYESKFVFTPQKDLATSCGCGVSFSPRSLPD